MTWHDAVFDVAKDPIRDIYALSHHAVEANRWARVFVPHDCITGVDRDVGLSLQLFDLMRNAKMVEWYLLLDAPDVFLTQLSRCISAARIRGDGECDQGCLRSWLCNWYSAGAIPATVSLGVRISTQTDANTKIRPLTAIPAGERWACCSPLLEKVELADLGPRGVNWVVVGGDTGESARECRTEWVTSLVDQCRRSRVPIWVSHVGDNVTTRGRMFRGGTIHHVLALVGGERRQRVVGLAPGGADPRQWPSAIRKRETPWGDGGEEDIRNDDTE